MPSRLVFTNWDPSCYPQLSGDQFIIHLIDSALRSQTVLMRDNDLSYNAGIARIFAASILPSDSYRRYRSLFEELLDTGIFQVVLMRPDDFQDGELAELATHHPVRARALYVRRKGLFVPCDRQPDAFDPDQKPFRSFHEWLDGVLTQRKSVTTWHPPGTNIPEQFRAEVLAVTQRCRANLQDNWAFGSISPAKLDTIGELMSDVRVAKTYLSKERIADADRLARAPRKLFYEIAETKTFAEEKEGLKRLAQSIFAAVYSDAHDAAGIYNNALPEPPAADDEAVSDKKRSDEFTTKVVGQFELRPGIIATALKDARQAPAVNHFITSMEETLDRPTTVEALRCYADSFATRYAEIVTSETSIPIDLKIVFNPLSDAVFTTIAVLAREPLIAAFYSVAKGVAHLLPRMSRYWRSARVKHLLSPELQATMDERCQEVRLLSRSAAKSQRSST